MTEMLRPARAVAPGRIILRELEYRGWSQLDLAAIMGRPEQAISEIVQAKKQITVETARQLASAFGTTPDFWLNLEMYYQLHRANNTLQDTEIARRSKLYHLAPVREMTRRGWMRPCATIDEEEQEYCRFYQVSSVDQQPDSAFRLRVSEDRGPEERAILAWVKRVEHLASEQPVHSFSPDALPSLIDALLACTAQESKIQEVPALFLGYGIHFVVVPHLQKTFLDGAAMWIKNRPVVAVSLRYDRIDAFWFTVLHELAHIYLGHSQTHVDRLMDRETMDLAQEELNADALASKWLLADEALKEWIETHKPRLSRQSIEEFAALQNRAPGIVIGQLMHRGEIKYSHLREYLVKVRPYIEKWVDVPYPN